MSVPLEDYIDIRPVEAVRLYLKDWDEDDSTGLEVLIDDSYSWESIIDSMDDNFNLIYDHNVSRAALYVTKE